MQKNRTNKEEEISFRRDTQDVLDSQDNLVYSVDEKPLLPEIKKTKNKTKESAPVESVYKKEDFEASIPSVKNSKILNRGFINAPQNMATLLIITAVVSGVFFVKDKSPVSDVYKKSFSLTEGFGKKVIVVAGEVKDYFTEKNAEEKKYAFQKLSNDKLYGAVEESSVGETFAGALNNFSKKISGGVKELLYGTRNYFSGLFGGRNKIVMEKIIPIKQIGKITENNKNKNLSWNPPQIFLEQTDAKNSLTNTVTQSHSPESITYNYNLKTDITRREVLDLIKRFDDTSKSLIYASNLAKGTDSLIVNQTISDLKNKIDSLEQKASLTPRQLDHVYNSVSRSFNEISSLDGVTMTNSSFSGTTGVFTGALTGVAGTFSGNLSVGSQLTVSGTATSTLAGDTSFDSGTLYVDSVNNRVGIASSSPSETLSLNGPAYLSQISAPSNTTDRLYNSSGDLYWNGNLIGSASVGNWTSLGGNVYRSSGNVGIGTTSPSTKLSVGGVAGDETGHGYFTGGLGVGILNTVANSFRVGQCVTGDTKLRRRRRKNKSKKSNLKFEGEEAGYIYDEVAIKDIKAGDEIASLDTKTNKIVWSKVKQLAYMGKKQTYRLSTEDGRQIRTTANHPYLTEQGWVKVSDLRQGMPIAVPRDKSKQKPRVGVFIDNANLFYAQRSTGWKVDIEKFASVSDGASLKFIKYFIALPQSNDNSFNATNKYVSKIKKFAEVYIKQLKYIAVGGAIVKKGDIDVDLAIDAIRNIDEFDIALIVSGDSDYVALRDYLLEKGKKVVFAGFRDNLAYELKGGKYIAFDNMREDIELGNSGNKKTPEYDLGRILLPLLYSGEKDLSNVSLKTVDNSVAWVKIRSIEPVAEEDVYDVEIENTHNFIGNDIVAHNTAFIVGADGKTGVGTTTPNWKLSVAGIGSFDDYARSSYFTATSTTATSTFSGGLSIAGTGTGLNFGSDTLFYQNNQRFLTSSTTSAGNLTIGYQSATELDTNGGLNNTGVGYQTLGNATSTRYNTALGYQALKGSATISNAGLNTAVGYQSLFSNTTGRSNTANGVQSLYSNTTGIENTANGVSSLLYNTTGIENTANGAQSLLFNTTGNNNTANGSDSLRSNTTGSYNTANGSDSFRSNTTGLGNVSFGYYSGYGDGAIEDQRSVIDDYATFVGYQASRDASVASTTALTNIAAIGKNARVGASNSIVLGGTGADAVRVGIGTTSPFWKLSVSGIGSFDDFVRASYFTATSTTASTFPYASTTALTVSGDSFNGSLTVTGQTTLATTLTGLLKGASGVVSAITTSLGLAGEISDETGSGALVFGTSPTFTTQITTPSIISAGALGITPASGSNLNVNLAGTGDLAVNTNQLYVDTSTGNVGIGTAGPGAKLVVAGITGGNTVTIGASDSSNISLDVDGTGAYRGIYIRGDSAYNNILGYLTVGSGTGGASKLAVNGGVSIGANYFANNAAPTNGAIIEGNVGIGTTSPVSKFAITDSTDTTNQITIDGPSSTSNLHLGNFSNESYLFNNYFYNAGQKTDDSTLGSTGIVLGNSDIRFQYAAAAVAPSRSTAMTILQSNGNVGIGTTTPSSKLNLHDGDFYLSDTDVLHGMTDWAPTATYGRMSAFSGTNGGLNLIGLSDTDSEALYIQGVVGSSDPTDTTPAMVFAAQKKNGVVAQALGSSETAYQFKNYSTNLMTILGGGNVGIGTTTPNQKLSVYGNVELQGTAGATRYLITDENNTGTGKMILQAGGGSANYGGALNLYANAHATKPGWVTAGISSGSGGKFTVNDQGLGGGTDLFTVQADGNVGIGETSPGSKLSVSGGGSFGAAYDTTAAPTNGLIVEGNVGVGTASPGVKLDVAGGTIRVQDTGMASSGKGLELIYIPGTDNGYVQAYDRDTTAYKVLNLDGSSVLLNSNSGGNVGIGTTTPMSTLTVQAGATATGLVLDRSSANTAEWMRFDNASVPRGYVGYDSSTGGALLSGSLGNSFIVRAENALHLVSNGGTATNGITIATNGNVGIGTTTPMSLLSLKGSSGAQMTIAQADTNYTQLTVDASGNLTITPSGSTITIPDDNLKICAGDACQTTALNSGNGNLTVENNIEIGGNYNRTCSTGYVWVPGSAKFGTLPGFCVMKYEAKNDGSNNAVSTATGGPYVSIDQPTSRTKCEAIGLGYHLISEPEWMTIAENIAQTPINDMDDDAGLQLATGHSDNAPASALAATSASDPVVSGCNLSATMENAANAYSASSCEIQGDGSYAGDDNDKGFYGTSQAWATTGYSAGVANKSQLRTHVLSNGSVVWDIAGNIWEWTDAYVNGTAEKPAPTADVWAEYTAITDYTALNYSRPQNPAWTSANGIGQYYAGASVGQRGFFRGGYWGNGAGAGVFTLDLSPAPSGTSTGLGFRCSR